MLVKMYGPLLRMAAGHRKIDKSNFEGLKKQKKIIFRSSKYQHLERLEKCFILANFLAKTDKWFKSYVNMKLGGDFEKVTQVSLLTF
jgi:hypothetical protein